MSATNRWERVQELFESIEALPTSRRIEELERIEPDPGLRSEVLRLLQAEQDERVAQRDALRELAAHNGGSTVPEPAAVDWNRLHPDLKLLSLIGSGGAGTVFRALRTVNGVEQPVAVKIYHAHRSDLADQERFMREHRMLATLTDPGIVRFLDSGLTPDGKLYLVMELAEGEHITVHCDKRRLNIEARLELLLAVCRAVASAHARLIVHLDLKPSNILVTENGDIKLLDFGTARLIEHSRGSVITEQLTPHYSSPERLRGEPATVGSDVYSLGLILFELCSGGSPFPKQSSIVGIAERAAGRIAPTGPAEAITDETALLRGHTAARLRKQLKGDLESICAKALAFDAGERYMTVTELADDIRRYLAGQPVEAHGSGRLYRAGKFLGRNAGRLALASVVVLGLSAAAVYSWIQARNARQEAERAEATQILLISALSFGGAEGSKTTIADAIAFAGNRLSGVQSQDKSLAVDIELLRVGSMLPGDKQAVASLTRVLEMARAAGDVAREASTLSVLGYREYLVNRPDQAWEHLRQALDLWQRNRSLFSPVRSTSLLGTMGKSMTHVRPFDTTVREPLQACLQLSAESPRVPAHLRVTCLEALATSFMFGSQQYAQSLPLLVEAVELRRREAGDGDALAESLQLLGLNYRFLGRYGEDEQSQREAYRLMVAALGRESLRAANYRAVWATSLAGIGNFPEGLRQAESALAIYRRVYPQRAALLLWTPLSAVMTNACLGGSFTSCEAHAREAIETLGPNPSGRDTRLGNARGYLGWALANLNPKSAEARPMLEEALQMLREQGRNPPYRKPMEEALSKLPRTQ